MAIDPATWAMIIGGVANLAGGLIGDETDPQFLDQRGTFAGTGMDPRKIAEIQAGLIGGFGDLAGQVSSRPIDLSGTLVQQPPTFTGGVLPFDVGVTGVDPGHANPGLVSLPGLDLSTIDNAVDAINALGVGNVGTEELAERAGREAIPSRVRDFPSRAEPIGIAMPKALADDPMMGTTTPGVLNEFQQEYIDRELNRRQAAGLPTDFITDKLPQRVQRPKAPSGLDVLQQAATAPGKGVRRRAA